jgi:hypothetical protein
VHQHRTVLQSGSHHLEDQARHPGCTNGGITLELLVVCASDVNPGCGRSCAFAGGRHGDSPSRLDQQLAFDRPAVAAQHDSRLLQVSPQDQHLPSVRVGRVELGEQVITVVPHRDQSEVAHRRERSGTGTNGDKRLPAKQPQEGSIAGGWTELRGQDNVTAGTEHCGQGSVDSSDIPNVGEAEDTASAGSRRRCCGGGKLARPVGTGSGAPHGPRRLPLAQPAQQGRPTTFS